MEIVDIGTTVYSKPNTVSKIQNKNQSNCSPYSNRVKKKTPYMIFKNMGNDDVVVVIT